MNAHDIMLKLLEVECSSTITLRPGPMRLKVGKADKLAVKILLLLDCVEPPLTCGEAEDALIAALWWHGFMLASPMGDDDDA